MSDPAPNNPPPVAENPTSEDHKRSLFNHEAKNHECHHYMRTYGGQVANAMMFGFGATLGADAANGLVGDAKQWWRH